VTFICEAHSKKGVCEQYAFFGRTSRYC
jgi:hypothetical protein